MDKPEFLVTKQTITYRQCPDCSGGYNIRQFQGERMKVICTGCNGSGRKKITHRTEVPLQEALAELQQQFYPSNG